MVKRFCILRVKMGAWTRRGFCWTKARRSTGRRRTDEGDVVDVRVQGGEEYCPAMISRDHGDGTYDVDFGIFFMENETGVAARSIRKFLRSPLAIARREGHAEIVALLEEYQK